LVVQIPAYFGDAVRQGQRRAGVVGPFTGPEAVRTASTIDRDLLEGTRWLEFDGGAKGITNGEAEEGSAFSVSPTPTH
jgi:hypothetical protein